MASFSFPVMPESRAGSPRAVPGVGLVSFFILDPPSLFFSAGASLALCSRKERASVGCRLSAVSRQPRPATCHLPPDLPPTTCHLPPATCHLSPVTRHLSPEDVNCGSSRGSPLSRIPREWLRVRRA